MRHYFAKEWCPLANNVESLGNGTERMGLGMIILEGRPNDIKHAQASSYLGVVFEDLEIFEWNGKRRGIAWRLLVDSLRPEELDARLKERVNDSVVAQ